MNVSTPHYVLFSESSRNCEPGRWRFVLQATDGARRVVVDDVEPETQGERLELLTVVRGLEALDQPSRVTLVTPSMYVREGVRYGVAEWRTNGWRWESFGRMVPVKHCDLWQRIDRAMRFHQVECRTWRLDPPHHGELSSGKVDRQNGGGAAVSAPTGGRFAHLLGWLLQATRHRVAAGVRHWKRRGVRRRTTLVPCP